MDNKINGGRQTAPDPAKHKHGINMYKRAGCRCDVCEAAYSRLRASRRKHPEDVPMIDPEPLIKFIMDHDPKVPASMYVSFRVWRENGLDLFNADRQCCKRGVHPYEVFGDYWYDIPAVELMS